MSHDAVFVIGNPARLPQTVQQKLAPRQVDSLDRAAVCLALGPPDGRWPEGEWALLRQAHQDHRRRVFGLSLDGHGRTVVPPKPWPGSRWIRLQQPGALRWYELTKDAGGYDPGSTRILFPSSQHRGKRLDELALSYCDWLIGEPWLEPDSFLGRMLRLYLGRQAATNLAHLDVEPFDSRGFIPGERLNRRCKDRRPRPQTEADDESVSQWLRILPRSDGQRKGDIDRVVHWKSLPKEEARRVRWWLNALDAIDRIGRAEDIVALDQAMAKAQRQIEVLATAEGSEPVAEQLHQEAQEAERDRRRQLTEQVPDWVSIRTHEVIRWMRSAATLEDLLCVGLWVNRHKDLLDLPSLQWLRKVYCFHRQRMHDQTVKSL